MGTVSRLYVAEAPIYTLLTKENCDMSMAAVLCESSDKTRQKILFKKVERDTIKITSKENIKYLK